MADRKVKQQKEIEQLSPEALEKEIENNKRKIVQSIVFIAAAAIALIAICMAWFVSNSRVNGTLVTVSAKYSGIEIGSEGIAGVHDDFLQKIKKEITSYFPTSDEEHYTSSGGSINWLTRGTGPLAFYRGPLAQFMSPVAHTHKCKNCAEEMENQTNFSVQQPVRVFLKI